ncbi:unnamed protein product [marine sediment metagenome]|uniref:Uncharacterized protein n=1 Tax=marine sediment metagenome TaxID=412755 RepID=X0S1S9_9ZZZZ
MGSLAEKYCGECALLLPLREYYRDSRRKDGHRSECKSCTVAMRIDVELRRQEKRKKTVTNDRDKKRMEMDAKLASMGLL